jgi:hypothetical protein
MKTTQMLATEILAICRLNSNDFDCLNQINKLINSHEDIMFLDALGTAGVDNWYGYHYAVESLNRDYNG